MVALSVGGAHRLQSIVSLSSTEVEYVGATLAVGEILCLRDPLCELGVTGPSLSVLNMDNRRAVSQQETVIESDRTKHIDIRHQFIRVHVEEKRIRVQYIPTDEIESRPHET